ncbi:hypothetical protein DFA_04438 [Cavenderia fasciculata]|uniref:Ankyrin repeat-containing protein n=1 Tax=Cavenderia fasciculata TaxID=261658 RepID=F4PPK7_CACFS|nr:uncharacterized protein DFA_04438 [Cavenderia fasciculata]EGG22320.1 hypothetical protein DFA_04438 [Cavenderia fasciculata]|eukprot:XP_004360171.1 hypothetical protein DFA_04438 [Cavenderia fasciculata]
MTITTTFHSIFRAQYIRQLIFDHVGDISNLLYPKEYKSSIYESDDDDDESGRYDGSQRSLKGRNIIRLPLFGMISKFAMPWGFVCHYLPKDDDDQKLLPKRRKRLVTQYCHHPNATLDTLERLLKWSRDDIDWVYLKGNKKSITNQEILEYLIKRCQVDRDKDDIFIIGAIKVACQYGYLSSVKLMQSAVKSNPKAIVFASSNGFIDIVKYLHENGAEGGDYIIKAMDEAARHGHLEIVKFLHFNRTEGCSTKALDGAAKNGHLEIVQFLDEHRHEGCTQAAVYMASGKGHLDVVKYLCKHRGERVSKRAMNDAAGNGHIDVVRYLHKHRTEGATTNAMNQAAGNGHIEIVKFLSECRSEGATTDAMDSAAERGHIDIVKYLHFNRSEGATTDAMDWAANNGFIDIVKFLHFNRTEGATADAMDWAASNNDIEMIKFLHEHRDEGATTNAMDEAASEGHIEVVKYLHEHRSEGATTNAIDEAAQNGHIEILRFLSEHRTEYGTTDAMGYATRNGHFEIVKYLHFNGCKGWTTIYKTCRKSPIQYACEGGYLEIVSFLLNVRKEKCDEKLLQTASTKGHYDIVKLILPQFVGTTGIESIKSVINQMKEIQDHFEITQLLENHLKQITNFKKIN